jgi:hypothetical protein
MMSHTILYIDEIRKGNYKIFLEHVFSQSPTPFHWSQVDEEILKQHSQELLEIANDLAETYCTVMSNTNIEFFRNQECTEFVKNWWTNYVQGPNNDMYWVKLGIMALELFNKNVGVAVLTSLPTQLSATAFSIIIKASQQSGDHWKLSMVLGKLAALTTALYSELLVHMIVEETGSPLSVFMNLAGHVAEQMLEAYRKV